MVVPVGLAAIALALLTVPESSDRNDRHLDIAGQVLGALALGGLAVAAIEWGESLAVAAAAIVIALGAGLSFVSAEWRQGQAALVPLDIFGIHSFAAAVTATTAMTFGMYGVLFLLPLTWQSTGRLDAVGAGIALMPMALVFVLVSPFSGPLESRFGAQGTTSAGVALIGTGLLMVGLAARTPSIMPAEIGLALAGLGMGLATGPLMGLAVGAVNAARAGTAAALINVARMAGATLGVAVLGAVYAAMRGGSEGLRAAMLLGGGVQCAGAGVAWLATRPKTVS